MSKSVVINLGSGNLEDGFPRIAAQLWTAESSRPEQYIGSLPPAPALSELYRSWKMHYQSLCHRRQPDVRDTGDIHDRPAQDDELVIFTDGITNVSQTTFDGLCRQFDADINFWLKSGSFLNIERQMRSQLDLTEEVRVIIETNDDLLRRLPWHCWEFFRDYSRAEVAFSRSEYKRLNQSSKVKGHGQQVRILAILGNNRGIDLAAEQEFLSSFTDAEVKFLVNPTREAFNHQLWDDIGWDILFFAGHSQTEGETGRIYLNEDETSNSLTIDQLEEALKIAIERGLKLSIFNSCDGMGLGLALDRLNMPVGIVMREPIPNRVAQEFFKFFLDGFARNDLSLPLSVQHARRKLQGLEDDFPGASWLPAICMNPAVEPQSWMQMRGQSPCSEQEESTATSTVKTHGSKRRRFSRKLATSGVVSGLIVALSFAGLTWRERQKAHLKDAEVFSQSSKVLSASNQGFNALIASLKAQRSLEQVLSPNPDVQNTVSSALKMALYGVDERNRLVGHSGKVYAITFSPDCQLLASGSDDKTVKLWKKDGTLLKTLTGHRGTVRSVSFNTDLQMLASGSDDKTIKLWENNGALLKTLTGHQGNVRSVTFSPDGQTLASASADRTIRLWSKNGALLKTLTGHKGAVHSVSFSSDGQTLVSASADRTIRLWSKEGKVLKIISGFKRPVLDVTSSPDGQTLAATSEDGTLQFWTPKGKLIKRVLLETTLHQVRFSLDGQTLFSSDGDGTVKIWNRNGVLLKTLEGHKDSVLGVGFSPKYRWIASASADRTIKLWSLDTPRTTTFRGHSAHVMNAIFSPNDQTIVTTSADHTAKLWSRSGTLRATLKGHQGMVHGISYSPDSTIIATSSGDKTIKFWGIDGKNLKTLKENTGEIYDVSFSPDGETLASASIDGTVKLWSRAGKLLQTLKGHKDAVHRVKFSPNGEMIVSVSHDRTAKLWSKQGKLLQTFSGHVHWVHGVSFSPDSQTIATASYDKTVKLWNRQGELLKTFKGHHDRVLGVTFSPDGKLVASSSRDRTVKFWTLDGQEVSTLRKHDNSIHSVSFSHDGQSVVSASDDNTAILWNLQKLNQTPALLKEGCQWVSDYLRSNPRLTQEDRGLCDSVKIDRQ